MGSFRDIFYSIDYVEKIISRDICFPGTQIPSIGVMLDEYQKRVDRGERMEDVIASTHASGLSMFALLYYDDVYGQWGFQFYQAKELLTKNALWQSLYDGWSTSFLVFAESRGDSDLLLLDTSCLSNIAGECYVIDGDTGCPVHTWQPIGQSFGRWLDRLVVAQGTKYWRRY